MFETSNNNENKKVVIELDNVRRDFLVGDETVHALKGVSFKIYEGEFVTIMGKSGSGKSTLLNQLGCLDTPSKEVTEKGTRLKLHSFFLNFNSCPRSISSFKSGILFWTGI